MQEALRPSVKKIVIIGMLSAITVPFILLTDIYPFFRFGMFAEPVKEEIQMEQFAIRYTHHNQATYLLDPAEVGLSSLAYLMRNYYYRQQSHIFLQRIHQLYTHKANVKEWHLLRITGSLQQPAQTDTATVATFIPIAAL
ncbi:hypothetical protein GXP67_13265 [Rhodocytophaga rosea]|uniref:Uncharacterized protein n=1 Tax=Rhodocytophaga rosea TaxID=2704465 RepID=A0A6C0GHL5_9BACT|nr:hypothetical protein [Rhodocytophaga rosea]QHT67526.1 hypothetical protein GXP67_13265 [Rhodocytophaga rosea]